MSDHRLWLIANVSWGALALVFVVWSINNTAVAWLERRGDWSRLGRPWRWSDTALGAVAWLGLALLFLDVLRRRLERGPTVGDTLEGSVLRVLVAAVVLLLLARWAFGERRDA